jgi:hypothetical protein
MVVLHNTNRRVRQGRRATAGWTIRFAARLSSVLMRLSGFSPASLSVAWLHGDDRAASGFIQPPVKWR